MQADVSVAAEVEAAVRQAEAAHGPANVLFILVFALQIVPLQKSA